MFSSLTQELCQILFSLVLSPSPPISQGHQIRQIPFLFHLLPGTPSNLDLRISLMSSLRSEYVCNPNPQASSSQVPVILNPGDFTLSDAGPKDLGPL